MWETVLKIFDIGMSIAGIGVIVWLLYGIISGLIKSSGVELFGFGALGKFLLIIGLVALIVGGLLAIPVYYLGGGLNIIPFVILAPFVILLIVLLPNKGLQLAFKIISPIVLTGLLVYFWIY